MSRLPLYDMTSSIRAQSWSVFPLPSHSVNSMPSISNHDMATLGNIFLDVAPFFSRIYLSVKSAGLKYYTYEHVRDTVSSCVCVCIIQRLSEVMGVQYIFFFFLYLFSGTDILWKRWERKMRWRQRPFCPTELRRKCL